MKIFCFPYAGGSIYSLKQFERLMPAGIEWIPIEPPGRGRRVHEALIRDLYALSADIFKQIRGRLDEPYAIYGHSMGAMLAYLVAKRIMACGLPAPLQLFVSGCGAPSGKPENKGRYLLPTDKFWAALRELGGSPDEVLHNTDLQRFFEPILRADFEAIENYQYQQGVPLDIPITVMIGSQEAISRKDAGRWQEETLAPVEVVHFPGNHFFIFEQARAIAGLIQSNLQLVNTQP
jgi:surfactin synthase thioesterase subunit